MDADQMRARYRHLHALVLACMTSPVALTWKNPRTVRAVIDRAEAEIQAIFQEMTARGYPP